jgi:formylglycine-generating enzyme required for sulfatase activity
MQMVTGGRRCNLELVLLIPVAMLSVSSNMVAEQPSDAERQRVNSRDGQVYVWIRPGTFSMGCSPGDADCHPEEKPSHTVRIRRGFWIGQTVVTVDGWRRYRKAVDAPALPTTDPYGRGGLNEGGGDDMPAVLMDWSQARGYCAWVGGQLPTEAQWEYAARAGDIRAHSGNLDETAWYGNNSGRERIDTAGLMAKYPDGDAFDKALVANGNAPHRVRQKRANAWGLYDMFGSVSQWLADWFDRAYYARSPKLDPTGPSGPEPDYPQRVIRGNSWDGPPDDTRVSRRGRIPPGDRYSAVGLRCVLP